MPRNFLAPYSFKIDSGTKSELEEFLKKLKEEIFSDERDFTRLRCEELSSENNIIFGYLEYGKYGTVRPVLDDCGNETKEIETNESPMDKYFYLFKFKNSNEGYLILQRIGNIGVRTILGKAMQSQGIKIKIEPIILGIKDFLKHDIVDFTIEIPKIPNLIDEKMSILLGEKEVNRTIISFKAKKNSSLKSSKLIKFLKDKLMNQESGNIGYLIDENEELKITVRVGKSRRTISIISKKVRTWIEVKDLNNIHNQANILIDDIVKMEGFNV